MDKFAKRLQSRLSSKGYRFNKEECRQALACSCANPELPTDEEMILAFNRLACASESAAGEISIVPVEVEEIIQAQEPENIPEPQTFDIPVEDLPCLQPPSEETEPTAALTVAEVPQSDEAALSAAKVTQAIEQAVAQVGAEGNNEAIQLLSSLANELNADIKDVEEMTSFLITAYLGKRQNILASAIGTVQSLRSAQTSSFQAGLDQDFFDTKQKNKNQFLKTVEGMFN